MDAGTPHVIQNATHAQLTHVRVLSCCFAAVHAHEVDIILLACISSTGVVTCHKANLATPPGLVPDTTHSSSSTDPHDTHRVWQVGDASKTATAVCFLPGAHSVAVAYAQDASVQVWWMGGMAQLQPHADNFATASQTNKEQGFGSEKPMLITTLTGHTDHILAMSSSGCTVTTGAHHHDDDEHNSQHPEHNAAPDVSISANKNHTDGAEVSITFLFSASRDQSVRGWVLYESQLIKTAKEVAAQKQKQQQEAVEAAARRGDTAQHADTSSAAGAAQDGEADRAPSLSHFLNKNHSDTSTNATIANAISAAQAVEASGGGDVDSGVSVQDTPSFLVPAPGKNDITGVPGARPKGAKKPAVLGAKPMLETPDNTSLTHGNMVSTQPPVRITAMCTSHHCLLVDLLHVNDQQTCIVLL